MPTPVFSLLPRRLTRGVRGHAFADYVHVPPESIFPHNKRIRLARLPIPQHLHASDPAIHVRMVADLNIHTRRIRVLQTS